MNIDDCIKVLQAHKDGKRIQYKWKQGWEFHTANEYNFIDFEYRLAPDVVYKIERDGQVGYWSQADHDGTTTKSKTTKGYWVEGEAS